MSKKSKNLHLSLNLNLKSNPRSNPKRVKSYFLLVNFTQFLVFLLIFNQKILKKVSINKNKVAKNKTPNRKRSSSIISINIKIYLKKSLFKKVNNIL